jgi:DNA-binding transcriptional ArsR family regulator
MTQPHPELLAFFRALADANRLKLVGLLAHAPQTVEQLAAALGVGSSTVSHHLRKLADVGLVHARADGPYSVYRLDPEPLRELAKRLLVSESLPPLAADADLGAFDRRVLKAYLEPDGRFWPLPSKSRQVQVLARHALAAIEPGVTYSEKQLNERLQRYTDDTATIRRTLVDLGLLGRTPDGAAYWRVAGVG